MVVTKRMFGGIGLYRDDIFFGMIIEDRVYFKVNDADIVIYESHNSQPFSYDMRDRSGNLVHRKINSLWAVPDNIVEHWDQLCLWGQRAYIAALQSHKPKRSKPASRPKASFRALGPKSRLWLKAIQIETDHDLFQTGAVMAYHKLKANFGDKISLNMLWALYATIHQIKNI